jgi:hypothetical protein
LLFQILTNRVHAFQANAFLISKSFAQFSSQILSCSRRNTKFYGRCPISYHHKQSSLYPSSCFPFCTIRVQQRVSRVEQPIVNVQCPLTLNPIYLYMLLAWTPAGPRRGRGARSEERGLTSNLDTSVLKVVAVCLLLFSTKIERRIIENADTDSITAH